MTGSETGVLRALMLGDRTVAAICERTALPSPTVARVVEHLERMGLVRSARGSQLGLLPERTLFIWLSERPRPRPVPRDEDSPRCTETGPR